MDESRGIGKDNKLPWYIPEDLKRFRELTLARTVIMGRKTFESIGRPLSRRTNIVITRNTEYEVPLGVKIADSIESALQIARNIEEEKIFIIGGGQIFYQTIHLASRLYLTIVEGKFEADTFFPQYLMFDKVVSEVKGSSHGYNYRFLELVKSVYESEIYAFSNK